MNDDYTGFERLPDGETLVVVDPVAAVSWLVRHEGLARGAAQRRVAQMLDAQHQRAAMNVYVVPEIGCEWPLCDRPSEFLVVTDVGDKGTRLCDEHAEEFHEAWREHLVALYGDDIEWDDE